MDCRKLKALSIPETPQIDANRLSELSHTVVEGVQGPGGGGWSENVFVRRREIVAQGERLPKRDIVDTYFHASGAARQSTATQTPLPTT